MNTKAKYVLIVKDKSRQRGGENQTSHLLSAQGLTAENSFEILIFRVHLSGEKYEQKNQRGGVSGCVNLLSSRPQRLARVR